MILDLEDLSLQSKEKAEFILKLSAMGSAQSEALAAQIVLYKSLGLFKTVAITCMAELLRRRLLGEEFDFENFIDSEMGKLPKVQPLDMEALRGMINVKQLASLIGKG